MSLETTSWEEIWAFVVIVACPSGEALCLWSMGLSSGKSREDSGDDSET